MGRTCKAKGCSRSAVSSGRQCQVHGGPTTSVTIPQRPWPTEINGHQVQLEENLEEGLFYFYCEECSSGSGLGVGEVKKASPKERHMMKKFVMAIFIEDECNGESGPDQADTNINVQPGSQQSSAIVNVSDGGLDSVTKHAIAENVRNKKIGELATQQNLNRI